MVEDLQALPARLSRPILAAWNAKEDLLDLLALAAPVLTGPSSPSGCFASATAAPLLTRPNSTTRSPPSRLGGPRS
jgi:hypothetical protein